MTVAELMTELAKWPPDLIVLVPEHLDGHGVAYNPVNDVYRNSIGLVIE